MSKVGESLGGGDTSHWNCEEHSVWGRTSAGKGDSEFKGQKSVEFQGPQRGEGMRPLQRDLVRSPTIGRLRFEGLGTPHQCLGTEATTTQAKLPSSALSPALSSGETQSPSPKAFCVSERR